MRWLADECVSPFLVARLRDGGHNVLHMAEIAPGVPDSDIVKRADQDHRLLLTEDKDFGELLFRWHQAAPPRSASRDAHPRGIASGPDAVHILRTIQLPSLINLFFTACIFRSIGDALRILDQAAPEQYP